MSRSGYSDDLDNWATIKWRGAVSSAIRGRRGQAFLREMLAALDALEAKRLIANDLERDGEVCAIGAVGVRRGIDMSAIDPDDCEQRDLLGSMFGIASALAAEIMALNDERYYATPEERFERVRAWVAAQIVTNAQS